MNLHLPPHHLSREQLHQFSLGLSPAEVLEAVERHVRDCSVCWAILQELPQSDPFLEGLRVIYQQTTDPEETSDARDTAAPGTESWRTFLRPASQPEQPGRLDHYEVLEVLGRGGMGVVFKACDTQLGRLVAIKMLAPEMAADSAAWQRFEREARAAAAIRDPHVIDIHAVSTEGAIPYLVMEHIAGCSLQERIKDGPPLEILEILQIGLQVAQGLAAAHAQGLIHRDVKPANILLAHRRSKAASLADEAPKQGCFVYDVKLTDFGLARAGEDSHLTRTGLLAGTPLYMSPEQAEGRSVDQRSDLFSLGSVLYQLATGQAPFLASTPVAVLKRICDHVPRPIGEVNAEVPAPVVALIDRLLAKDPAQRFRTAAEVADMLSRFLAQLKPSAPLPAVPAPVLSAAVASSAARQWRILAAVSLLLLLLVLTTAVLWRFSGQLTPGHGEEPRSTPATGTGADAVKPAGPTVSTFAGGLSGPYGLAFDSAGNLYVTSWTSGVISKVTPAGTATTFATGFDHPHGLVFDKDGILYVSSLDETIKKVTPAGEVRPFVSKHNGPGGMVFDASGNLYVALFNYSKIIKITPAGVDSPFVSSGLNRPIGLAIDHDGNLYVANSGANTIAKVTPGGGVSTFASGVATPVGLALDGSGNLYVSSFLSNGSISKVTRDGIVHPFVAGLKGPNLLALDAAGNLYVADAGTDFRGTTVSKLVNITPAAGRRPLPSASGLARRPSPLDGRKHADIPRAPLALASQGDPDQAPPELVAVLGDGRFRHREETVNSVAYSPDGKLLVSTAGTWDGKANKFTGWEVKLWESATGNLVRDFKGHTDGVRAGAFSPDGKRLATAGDDGTIRLWDPATHTEQRQLPGQKRSFRLGRLAGRRPAAGRGRLRSRNGLPVGPECGADTPLAAATVPGWRAGAARGRIHTEGPLPGHRQYQRYRLSPVPGAAQRGRASRWCIPAMTVGGSVSPPRSRACHTQASPSVIWAGTVVTETTRRKPLDRGEGVVS